MTTELYPYAFPNGTKILIEWLKPMVAPGAVRSEKPNGSVLPFIRVLRLQGNTADGLVNKGRYAVYVFGTDEVAVSDLADQVTRRIQLLGARFVAPAQVTIGSNTYQADNVIIKEEPRPMMFLDDTIPTKIYMYEAIYEVWLRIAAAS